MNVHPKLLASGAAGAVVVVLIWVASMFGLEVPSEVASAVTVLISAAAGYLRSAA